MNVVHLVVSSLFSLARRACVRKQFSTTRYYYPPDDDDKDDMASTGGKKRATSEESKSPRPSKTSKSPGRDAASTPHLLKLKGMMQKDGKDHRRIQPESNLTGLTSQFPDIGYPYSKGLVNEDTNCYRNAVLQGLFHIPAFYRYMGKLHQDCPIKSTRCFVCRLQYLCWYYWNTTGTWKGSEDHGLFCVSETLCRSIHRSMELDANAPVNLISLREGIQDGAQCDAREMLEYIIADQILAKLGPPDFVTYNDMFQLMLKTSWTCQDCGRTSDTIAPCPEIGILLPMAIAGMQDDRSLDWCLQPYFAFQRRTHCADLNCHHASRIRDPNPSGPERNVTSTILQAPEILFIHFLRFDQVWNARRHRMDEKKVFDRIKFPEQLDLSQFGAAGVSGQGLKYRLNAVVAHGGKTITRGHYIAACRTHPNDPLGDKFQVIDDDNSIASPRGGGIEDARRPLSANNQEFEPQMLMYSKIHVADGE